MAGREAVGAEFAGHRQQVGEFRPHVAANAGYRRAAGHVVVGEAFDDILAKSRLMVEDVMGDSEPVGNGTRVANIVARTAGALAPGGGAVVVKLEGDADDLRAARRGQRGHHRTVDATGHGDNDPPFVQGAGKLEKRGRVGAGDGGG